MKDQAQHHPDWLFAENPDYNNHDARRLRKLGDAIEYLRARQIWRGETNCKHEYKRSDQ